MGYNCSFVCVKGVNKADALHRLRLEETGETVEYYGADYICAELRGGWLLIFVTDAGWVSEARDVAVSKGGQAVSGVLYEVVNYANAWGYQDGHSVWKVTHDADADLGDVAVEGEPPPELAAIRAAALKAQAQNDNVDCLIDIPIDLITALTGFSVEAGSEAPFERLIWLDEPPPRKGFFARLFGGGKG